MSDFPEVSVVVPTYRRPEVLLTCLKALHQQTLEPMEVLVCRRETDTLTGEAIAGLSEEARRLIREVVIGPDDNFAKSLDAGIRSSQGEFVALTDDDAEPPADWLEKLIAGFSDTSIAGVGGRDVQTGKEPSKRVVGKVTWYGKVIGNHHIGVGPARDVDVLKGVNCCFRGELAREIGIDPRLRGRGTVIHTELSLCLPLRKAGWRLIYDPAITTLHHIVPRADGDMNNRGGFDELAASDIIHNQTLILREYLSPAGNLAFGVFAELIGTRSAPGLILLLTPRVLKPRIARWRACFLGRRASSYTALQTAAFTTKVFRGERGIE